METDNKCIVCGKNMSHKTFCSKKCQSDNFKNKQRKCKICGKSTTNKTYCSEECQHIGGRGKKIDKWETTRCLCCNIEFERLIYKKNKRICCSRKCADKYKKTTESGIHDPKNRVRHFSEETKLKHSKITKGLWKNEGFRKKVKDGQLKRFKVLGHWFGVDAVSVEKKKKHNIEKWGVEYAGWNVKEIRDKINKTCFEKHNKNLWEFSKTGGKNTKIENLVEKILIKYNIGYVKQYRIYHDEKKFKYKLYDFFLPNKNILIEVDGDYWHGNPKIFKTPNKMQLIAIENDIFKNNLAREKKMVLLRYWENEIYLSDFENKIINDLKNEKK